MKVTILCVWIDFFISGLGSIPFPSSYPGSLSLAEISQESILKMYGVASLIAVGILLPLIGTLLVGLRFFVRLRLRPTFVGIDDWLILFACVLVWSQGVIEVIAAVLGELGRDEETTVAYRIHHQQKLDYAVLLIEKITYSASKHKPIFLSL